MRNNPNELGIGVIGCGHWGPNHIRVFSEMEGVNVVGCADLNGDRLERIRQRFPTIKTTNDYRDLLRDPFVQAVVVATPTKTHATICREALQAGKHVLVEKPMCTTSEEAHELVRLADETGLVLMVGYVFVFNSGIIKLRELIANGELGKIQYLDAVRTNLGPIRGDVNALYDLGTHDISIFNYLLGAAPLEISAHGRCITQREIEDVCFATLKYPTGTIGHIHVSWLNPRKIRTITVVGEKKMAHWDDVDPSDTLRIYDKGLAEPPYYNSFGEFQYLLRSADVHLPAIRRTEPLVAQATAFRDWIQTAEPKGPDAREGLRVVEALEAAMTSLQGDGRLQSVAGDSIISARELSHSLLMGERRPFVKVDAHMLPLSDH